MLCFRKSNGIFMRKVNFSGRIDCLFEKKKKTFKLCQIIFLHLTARTWLSCFPLLSFSAWISLKKKINKRSNKMALGPFYKKSHTFLLPSPKLFLSSCFLVSVISLESKRFLDHLGEHQG